MTFSTTPASDDERGASGSRSGIRSAGAGLGGSVGGVSGRTTNGGGTGGGKPGVALATLNEGARVSPALSYEKIVFLPAGAGGIGLVKSRYER